MSMDGLNVLTFGASRNIGYYTAVRLLAHGASVTFLLRSTSVFDNDETIKSYITSGKAHLVKGDALKAEDVANAWAKASEIGAIDYVISTVGGKPTSMSLTKGALLETRNLCTQSVLNIFCTMPKSDTQPQPRFIFVSSNGLTKASHAKLPLVLKPLYSWMLAIPHADKMGAERVIHHCVGKRWEELEPEQELMKEGAGGGVEWLQREGLPAEGEIKHWFVVRPALLSDGACKADEPQKSGKAKEPYRTALGDGVSGYGVSRRDVGHFLAEKVVKDWASWENKIVGISY